MKKLGSALIIIILVVIVALVLCKNPIARKATTAGIQAGTGLDADIGSMNVGLVTTLVGIDRFRLMNPPGFHDEVMIDMPEIYVDYDLGALLKKKVHLEEVRLNLKEFLVVKNENGEVNLDALKSTKKEEEKEPGEKKEAAEMPEIQIDVLDLKIGKVVFKDYTGGEAPVVREFNINIDRSFENISNPRTLVNLIVVEALKNTSIAKLAGFDLASIQDEVSKSLDEAKKQAQETMEQATGEAQEMLKEQQDQASQTLKGILKTKEK
ncbi:MAG: hypothetical protein P9M00_10015 [Candidatus Tritonobacter lacicola]|nr:hypothetical protein [Candidatus Tritonobacter lacicola]